MGELNRAQNVCRACALRKKACDKSLPACGYCTKRGIFCKYGTAKPGGRGRRPYPGRNFVAISSDSPSAGSWNEVETRQAWVDPLFPSMTCASSQSFDIHVHRYACHILNVANLTSEGLGQRYFRTFDRSFPIISPQLFHQVVLKFGDRATPPPAGYSILLLGMLLAIGLQVPTTDLQSQLLGRERIYMTVRALVTQAQGITCISLQLLQAAFLIAACEHMSGRPEVAYTSVVSCIGMERILGVGETPKVVLKAAGGNCEPPWMKMERANVAWAIATLERIILCETRQRHLRPLTELPSLDSGKLPDLRKCQVFNDGRLNDLEIPKSVSPSTAHDIQNSTTKRQVQAISFLDQALRVTRSARDDEQTGLVELAELDDRIHAFLGTVLNVNWKMHDEPSTVVALAVRLLFLLHGAVIDTLPPFPSETEHQERMKSRDTLDAACNMVVDITRYRKLDQEDMMPICCYYNLQMSIEHLQRRKKLDGSGQTSDLKRLLESEKQYRKRWCFG